MRRWSFVLLLAALAGCAGDDAAPDAVVAPTEGPTLLDGAPGDQAPSAPLATPLEPQRDDAFRLLLEATPQGAIVAYVIDVPTGATVRTWYDGQAPILEYHALGAAAVEAWTVVIVDIGSGAVLQVISGAAGATGSASLGTPAGGASLTGPAARGYAWLDGIGDGDRIGIVLAIRGSGQGDLGLRFAAEDPFLSSFTPPAEDAEDFLARTSGITWLPEETGRGAGLAIDAFYDAEYLVLTPFASRFTTGNMQVAEVVPDTAGFQPANDLTAWVDGTAGRGFTAAFAWSWTQLHAGTVTIGLEARDAQRVESTSAMVPNPIVHGVVALALGDGDGPSGASLRVTYGGAPGVFPKLFIADHVALGVPLEDLLGVAVADDTYDEGLVTMRHDANLGTLVFERSGTQRVVHLPRA